MTISVMPILRPLVLGMSALLPYTSGPTEVGEIPPRLSESAWGDNIAIQPIGNMLNMTVRVLTSENPTLMPVTNPNQNNGYIGLVMVM